MDRSLIDAPKWRARVDPAGRLGPGEAAVLALLREQLAREREDTPEQPARERKSA